MENVETIRCKAMKTYLVASYAIVSCIFFLPANSLADENTERALAAENKMLKATIANLRAEIAKLQTEIKQLKEPPKQSDPIDSNSSKAVASPNTKPTSHKGNDILANAFVKYCNTTKDSTTAKRQEAWEVFFKESSSVYVTIDFTVADIRSNENNIATIAPSKGTITTSVKTVSPITISIQQLAVKMSSDIASKIDKGNKFTVTGVFEKIKDDYSIAPNSVRLHITNSINSVDANITNVVIALNGKRVELAN